jgi:hypothetical protein
MGKAEIVDSRSLRTLAGGSTGPKNGGRTPQKHLYGGHFSHDLFFKVPRYGEGGDRRFYEL